MSDLVDTTEMYIKAIYELYEDGVVAMRARIVERLQHSGPTVSQTVARLESNGLVDLGDNRQLLLTEKGMDLAEKVVAKHRYAEVMLVNKMKYPWSKAHMEACKWEHCMGDDLIEYFNAYLDDVDCDPYGNPIPMKKVSKVAQMPISKLEDFDKVYEIVRIGEPIQAEYEVISAFESCELFPKSRIRVSFKGEYYSIENEKNHKTLMLEKTFGKHLFVRE